MAKCVFNKVAKQLYWNHTSTWVFSCIFTACYQNTLFTEHIRATTSEERDLSVTLLKRDSGTSVFLWNLQKKIKNKKFDWILDTLELFWENSQQLKAVNCFRKEAPP